MRSVSKRYSVAAGEGEKWFSVLSDASLTGCRGEWIGIHGPNGIGKSVLCRLVAGLEKEDGGKILLEGNSIHFDLRREKVGYVFQFPSLQLPLPRLQNILDQTIPERHHDKIYRKLRTVLDIGKRVLEMTPCEQRLVILAIIMARGVDVLMIDEPTWACDEEETMRIIKFLADEGDARRLTIIVSHNARLLADACDRRYELREGVLKDNNDGRN